MKIKFFLLTFLVLFSRGCDFYSTSLWFFDNPTGETNPLYRYFGVGIYNSYREIVQRPRFVIYGLMILSLFYFTYRLWRREYKLSINSF
ncbi:MAG: hypothetical protein IPM04_08350 [Saprospiraceae bacterium]|nr:hypothetical protein [Candidatus Brachybacter algidus]MBK8747870.1 hypothetical protein [Candidatus Brachybacter algidus]